MDYKAIINLMKEMNQSQLTKLEVESEGIKICMEKEASAPAAGTVPQFGGIMQPAGAQQIAGVQQPEGTQQHAGVQQPAGAQQSAGVQQPAGALQPGATLQQAVLQSEASRLPSEDKSGYKQLLSPMVGTYYAQPSPEKPPFVKVGDTVKKGQTICIIEAMKLMNEIESEYDGVIVEALVDDEDMVEFGQPLFLLK